MVLHLKINLVGAVAHKNYRHKFFPLLYACPFVVFLHHHHPPPSLELGLPCNWIWIIKSSRNDVLWIFNLGFQMSCSFCFHPLETLRLSGEDFWPSFSRNERPHRERGSPWDVWGGHLGPSSHSLAVTDTSQEIRSSQLGPAQMTDPQNDE